MGRDSLDVVGVVAQHRMDNARAVEIGPRAYGAAIPENATPFMLALIWAEWESAFYRMNMVCREGHGYLEHWTEDERGYERRIKCDCDCSYCEEY